jgi:hypothetical protein
MDRGVRHHVDSLQSNHHSQGPFTSSLDSISETNVADASTKEVTSSDPDLSQVQHNQYDQLRRVSLPPLSNERKSMFANSQYRTFSNQTLPAGSEQLVYGYVHLQGFLTFDKSINTQQLQKELSTTRAFGGGSLEILGFAPSSSHLQHSNRRNSSGLWPSLRSRVSQEAEGGKISIFEFQSEPLFVDLILAPDDIQSCKWSLSSSVHIKRINSCI